MTKFVLTLTVVEILTAGYSSSVVECGFSARNRIDMYHRRRMAPYRQASSTLLHFENKLARNISFEFLVKWNRKSSSCAQTKIGIINIIKYIELMYLKWSFFEGNFQFALSLACPFFLQKFSTINYTRSKNLQYKPRIISIKLFNLTSFSFFSRDSNGQTILQVLTDLTLLELGL